MMAEYRVEQGPRWLADLLVGSAFERNVLMLVVVLLGIGLAVAVARRNLDRETKLQMLQNGLVVLNCGGVTVAAVRLQSWPYVFDVAVGAGVGFTVALLVTHAVRLLSQRQVFSFRSAT